MKRIIFSIISTLFLICCAGCSANETYPDIAATTLPVYEFTSTLCQGTDITVGRVVTESVSCLHDYTMQVSQMRMIEHAEVVVISGIGLEDFLEDALNDPTIIIDASEGAHIHAFQEGHNHSNEDHHDHGHNHDNDPHIWLSPENAKNMAKSICNGLITVYPEYRYIFEENLSMLLSDLTELQQYGDTTLSALSSRELITFHDGFAYFAESFHLTIVRAVEEESGSEASARELKELIEIVKKHNLRAIFTERNGSISAAEVIAAETDTSVFVLDMAMSGDSYFDAMYNNIDTIKEALE